MREKRRRERKGGGGGGGEKRERERESERGIPIWWVYCVCDSGIRDVPYWNDDLKLLHAMLLDKGVLVVGGEHDG